MHKDRLIPVVFFQLDSGREPVCEWLKGLDRDAKKSIGEYIKTLQFSWPVAMPLAKKLDERLWEVRSNIKDGISYFSMDLLKNRRKRLIRN